MAAMDELEIEAELEPKGLCRPGEDPEDVAKRAALREIDELKASGRYERTRARYWGNLDLDRCHLGEGLVFSPGQREFLQRWRNLREGMNSPDPAQAQSFQKFFEVGKIRERPLQQVNDLIAVLEPAKKKRGRKKESPAWRNEVVALDTMRVLCAGGLSIPPGRAESGIGRRARRGGKPGQVLRAALQGPLETPVKEIAGTLVPLNFLSVSPKLVSAATRGETNERNVSIRRRLG